MNQETQDRPWQTSQRKKQAHEKKDPEKKLEPVIDYDPLLEKEKERMVEKFRAKQ